MKPQSLATEVVIFPDKLYLTDVERDSAGNIVSGLVENGLWWLRIQDGHMHALREKNSEHYVNRWPVREDFVEVPVQQHWRGDYNAIIALAEKEYREE